MEDEDKAKPIGEVFDAFYGKNVGLSGRLRFIFFIGLFGGVGAVIGTLIVPIIGSVLGTFLGVLLGRKIAISINEKKKQKN